MTAPESDAPAVSLEPMPTMWPNLRVRNTPFTERVEAAGAKGYTVYNHMLLPIAFRSITDDYWHLKEHVQVWDVSCQRQIEIVGPDAARLAQMLTPRDLSKAVPGRCLYAPMVDAAGGLLNDPVILKLAEDRFWLSIADLDVGLWVAGLAHGIGLNVRVFEADVSPLAVQGPKANELVARVLGDAVHDIGFFRFAPVEFMGHEFLAARTGWSKQGGFEIYVDRHDLAGPLWDALFEAGADLDVGPGCPNLIERIEGGLLSYGNDITIANNPLECRLDQFCHLDADIDFIGRDALRRIRDDGPRRRTMGLFLDTDSVGPVRHRWPVVVGAETVGAVTVGAVTSAAWSPSFGQGVALAMMEWGWWTPGVDVVVETPNGPCPATVSEIPFEIPA